MVMPRKQGIIAGLKEKVAKRKQTAKERMQGKKDYKNKKSSAQAVSGTMKGKQVDTTKGPNMSKVNKPTGGSTGMKGKQVDTTKGPNMSVNKKPANKPAEKKTGSGTGVTMTSMGASKLEPRNKDERMNLKKRGPSKPGMTGFKKGGSCKSRKGYKSGGMVKRDGCAMRGKTRGRMV
jgi:hypothetical protein